MVEHHSVGCPGRLLSICVPNASGAAVTGGSEGGDNARRWSTGRSMGKRSSQLAFAENPETARYLAKRPEDSWNKLNSLWGKRHPHRLPGKQPMALGKRSAAPVVSSLWSGDTAKASLSPATFSSTTIKEGIRRRDSSITIHNQIPARTTVFKEIHTHTFLQIIVFFFEMC
uniref:Uncharacterized protein n=1 Tax=Ditylenchus dipsaci TaxID=166011 RepID=A0A915DZW1_9BILA